MSLLGYADDIRLAADSDAILTAAVLAGQTHPLTDAQGKPLAANHPLLARNPGFRTTAYAPVVTFLGKSGGLLRTDAFAEGVLGAAAVTARTKPEPVKPTKQSDEAVYLAALKALVPAVEPVIAGAVVAAADVPLDAKTGK